MGSGRGRRTDVESRKQCVELVSEASAKGCRLGPACKILGISLRTKQRWDKAPGIGDKRHGPATVPANKLTLDERTELIAVVGRV